MVDANALKANQLAIVVLVIAGFVLGLPAGAWLAGLVAVSLAIGAVWPGRGPFQQVYRRLFRARGWVKPDPRPDDPAPHRFAQSLGAVCCGAAALALFAGAATAGWLLAGLVATLALVNLVFGFCAGCFLFLHLRRAVQRVAVS